MALKEDTREGVVSKQRVYKISLNSRAEDSVEMGDQPDGLLVYTFCNAGGAEYLIQTAL